MTLQDEVYRQCMACGDLTQLGKGGSAGSAGGGSGVPGHMAVAALTAVLQFCWPAVFWAVRTAAPASAAFMGRVTAPLPECLCSCCRGSLHLPVSRAAAWRIIVPDSRMSVWLCTQHTTTTSWWGLSRCAASAR